MRADSLCTVSNVNRKAHVLCVREEPAWPMGAWTGRDPAAGPKKSWQNQNVGHYEFAIPRSALGLDPKPGPKIRFNAFAYMSEQNAFKCRECDGPDRQDPPGALVLR